VGRQDVERVTDQRELDQHDVAEQVDEPRSARPHGPVDVEHAEELAELDVILRFEVEHRPLAVAADLDGVLVGEPVGRRRVRDVRRHGEHAAEVGLGDLELRFELLHARRHARDLLDQPPALVRLRATDLLGQPVLLRAEVLDLRRQRTPALVEAEQVVDGRLEPAPREARAVRLGVLADGADVEHA
jgi:hypothetical protein